MLVMGGIYSSLTGEGLLVVEEALPDGLLLKPLECWCNPLSARNECLHEVQRNPSCLLAVLIFICYAALNVLLVCLRRTKS